MANKCIYTARNLVSGKTATVWFDHVSKDYCIKPNYSPQSWMHDDTEQEAINTAEQVVGNKEEA